MAGARVVVDVWVADPARTAAAVHVDILDDVERARAARLPEPAASRFVLGRALLRSALARQLDTDPHAVQLRSRCSRCGGPHGPVTVTVAGAGRGSTPRGFGEPVHVSVTRSGPVVAVAVCRQAPVGVDAESIRSVGAAPLADVALSAAELAAHRRVPAPLRPRAIARAWVRKEAALKALGTGILRAPQDLELRPPPRRLVGVDAVAEGQVAVADLAVGRRRVGAVAVVAPHLIGASGMGDRGPRLAVRSYDGEPLLRAGRRR